MEQKGSGSLVSFTIWGFGIGTTLWFDDQHYHHQALAYLAVHTSYKISTPMTNLFMQIFLDSIFHPPVWKTKYWSFVSFLPSILCLSLITLLILSGKDATSAFREFLQILSTLHSKDWPFYQIEFVLSISVFQLLFQIILQHHRFYRPLNVSKSYSGVTQCFGTLQFCVDMNHKLSLISM